MRVSLRRDPTSELRVFVYRDSPSLVFGQMPVEGVDFVKREYVDIVLNFLHAEEMPANVQMGASVSEGRLVGKEDARHCFAALDLDLDKAHQAVPYAVGATSAKADFTILSLKHIGLLGKARIQAQQHIGIAAVAHALPLSGAVFEREAAKAFQQL